MEKNKKPGCDPFSSLNFGDGVNNNIIKVIACMCAHKAENYN
jgi:hypothetical protein